jgi:FHS family glucose/mannose:H+ symporter-like MFS transporter
MNRLEVFFGLGALLIPIVSGLFIRILLWNGAFIAIAAAALTALLLWRTRAFGELVARLEGNRRRRTTAGRTPPAAYSGKERLLLAMMMVFFFIYVGVEISVANFLPSMQVDRLSVAPDTAAFSITALWATITFGRLFAGAVAERIGYAAFLMLGCLGTCAALTALVFADRLWSNYAAVLLFGLMLAGLFAIALVFANQAMPGKTSRTTSILIASGGIGGAVLPRLTGWLMDTAGTASTQWALAGLGAAMVLVVAAAMMYAKRRLPRPADPAAHPQQ